MTKILLILLLNTNNTITYFIYDSCEMCMCVHYYVCSTLKAFLKQIIQKNF